MRKRIHKITRLVPTQPGVRRRADVPAPGLRRAGARGLWGGPSQPGPHREKVLDAATGVGLSPDRHVDHYAGGNFADNGRWHVLTEASATSAGLQGGFPNLS